MLPVISRPSLIARLVLLVSLVLPSLDIVYKYAGTYGLLVYPVLVLVLIWRCELLCARLQNTNDVRLVRLLSVLALAGIAIAFFVVFPIADVKIPDQGSDTNEAYDQAVIALAHGHYPYSELTYLGNRIHHLPGALLLSAPFVAFGSSAYQSLFWVVVYLLVLSKLLGPQRGLMLFVLQFVGSPVLMHQIVTGSDGVMSGASVFVALWLFAKAWTPDHADGIARWGSLLLLALAISNRLNFVLIAIPVLMLVYRNKGFRQTAVAAVVLGALLALINLPFYFINPPEFAPLEGMDRLTRFEDWLPHVSLVLPALAVLLTFALGWRKDAGKFAGLMLGSAAGQFLLIVSGLLLSCIASGELNVGYAAYGCYFIFPLGFLAWQKLAVHRASANGIG